MIASLVSKETGERGLFYFLALIVAALVAAAMPFWFNFSLHQAMSRPLNDVSAAVLLNFRSYPRFITAQWAARTLPQVLFLIALIAGAPAIVNERESRTFALLAAVGVPLRTIVLVKYAVAALCVAVAAVLMTAVLLAGSAIAGMDVPVRSGLIASSLALLNAIAFLSVVFFASALASKTPFAVLYALIAGFALVALLVPFGINGMAMPDALYGVDGSLQSAHLTRCAATAGIIAIFGLGAAVAVTQERGAA